MTAMTRPIGFWLKLVDRLINDQFEATLGRFDVTRRQWQILTLVATGPQSRDRVEAELRPFLDAGEPSVDYALEGLLARGWVDADGPYFVITEIGRTQADHLGAVVRQTRDSLGHNLTPEQYDTTVATLAQMAHNLGWEGEVV
jgi:hypothetical protein